MYIHISVCECMCIYKSESGYRLFPAPCKTPLVPRSLLFWPLSPWICIAGLHLHWNGLLYCGPFHTWLFLLNIDSCCLCRSLFFWLLCRTVLYDYAMHCTSVPWEANSETDKHAVLLLRSALGMIGGTGRDKKQGWEQGDVQCAGRPGPPQLTPQGAWKLEWPGLDVGLPQE